MAPEASQLGGRARLRVLEGWVGINPAVTKPGSERRFHRKASSGGQEPTGPGSPHQPRPSRTPPAAPTCFLGLVGVVPTMASGGQQVPTFPGSRLEALWWLRGPGGCRAQDSAHRGQPLALTHPTHTQMGLMALVGTSCGQPGPCHLADCWAPSLSQAARTRLEGQTFGGGGTDVGQGLGRPQVSPAGLPFKPRHPRKCPARPPSLRRPLALQRAASSQGRQPWEGGTRRGRACTPG